MIFARSDIQSIYRKDKDTIVLDTRREIGKEMQIPVKPEDIEAGDEGVKSTGEHILVNLRPGVAEKKRASELAKKIIRERILPIYEKLVEEATKDRKEQQEG